MTWKFFRVDTGVKGRPFTESGSREVITGKAREEKHLENGHVELQAAHPSILTSILKCYWKLGDRSRLERTVGYCTHRPKV